MDTKQEITKEVIAYAIRVRDEWGSSDPQDVEAISMWRYFEGLRDTAAEILTGEYEDEGLPFVVMDSLDDPDLQARFRDAWGAEIGSVGAMINIITTRLVDETSSQ